MLNCKCIIGGKPGNFDGQIGIFFKAVLQGCIKNVALQLFRKNNLCQLLLQLPESKFRQSQGLIHIE